MEINRDGIIKKETKRFYEFDFEQLVKALELKGEFVAFDTKDNKGKDTSTLKIITIIREDVK